MTINQLIEQRFGLPSQVGQKVMDNSTIAGILNHRSCRRFYSTPLEEDMVQTLFATAFSAPSKSDLQQACVVRIQDPVKQERIAGLSPNLAWISQAPLFMVWCGDSRRIRKLGEWRNHPFANDHLDAFLNPAVDVGITMQTYIIAAESLGLGCCPVSQVRDFIDAISSELNLPNWVFPVAGLCVGWPDEENNISMRLPLEVTVHTDCYDDDNLIQHVIEYDIRRESLEKTPPEKQRNTDRFGINDDYGWSEDRTRQYAEPLRADFGQYIRGQEFDLT